VETEDMDFSIEAHQLDGFPISKQIRTCGGNGCWMFFSLLALPFLIPWRYS